MGCLDYRFSGRDNESRISDEISGDEYVPNCFPSIENSLDDWNSSNNDRK